MDSIRQYKQYLISSFAEKSLEEIINMLKKKLPTEEDKYFDLILLSNEYNEIKKEDFHGVAFYEQIQVRLNRIRKNLIDFIRNLHETDFFGYTNVNGIIKYKDGRDGQTYSFVEVFDQIWMTENLNLDSGDGCWFYENDPQHEKEFGRLYHWELAQDACWPGWRLPTPEDIITLDDNIKSYSQRTLEKRALMDKLKLNLGGYRKSYGVYEKMNEIGYYWTSMYDSKSSSSSQKRAFYFTYQTGRTELIRMDIYANVKRAFSNDIRNGYALRFIKDV